MTWVEYITDKSSDTIISSGKTLSDPPNRDIYNIISPGEGTYNLQIDLLATSGGRYRCQESVPVQVDAYVHVIVMGKELGYCQV